MGGTDASEPELPPAYVAVHAAYQRLTRIERSIRRRRSVEAAMAAEWERIRRLLARLKTEEAELDGAATRLRRPSLPPWRRGDGAELSARWATVEALRAEIVARYQAREELSLTLGPASGPDPAAEVAAATAELDAALAAWQAAHRAAGSALGARLEALERREGEIVALRREVDEAALAARQASAALLVAARAVFKTSTVWNPYRPKTFPAKMVRAINRSGASTAETAVGRLQRWLLQLDAELSDLHHPLRPELAPPATLLATMERWFEDVFSEWLVHGQLDLSARAVATCQDRLRELVAGLSAYHRALGEQLADVDVDRRAALLEHPGVV